MGRKQKGKSTLTRVRESDLIVLRSKARTRRVSIPDYLSMIVRRRKKL